MYNRILLPLDGSALAEKALPHAIAQAERFQAELILLKVLELLPKDRRLSSSIVKATYDLTETLAREYLAQVALNVQKHKIPVQAITVEGRPHAEIVQYAETNAVDLIVMSTHGYSGFGRWLMGSVADRVARGASVPVLLVHVREKEENNQGKLSSSHNS